MYYIKVKAALQNILCSYVDESLTLASTPTPFFNPDHLLFSQLRHNTNFEINKPLSVQLRAPAHLGQRWCNTFWHALPSLPAAYLSSSTDKRTPLLLLCPYPQYSEHAQSTVPEECIQLYMRSIVEVFFQKVTIKVWWGSGRRQFPVLSSSASLSETLSTAHACVIPIGKAFHWIAWLLVMSSYVCTWVENRPDVHVWWWHCVKHHLSTPEG